MATRYEKFEDATEDGWISIDEARERLRGSSFRVVDVSGPHSFGYHFAVMGSGEPVCYSQTIWFTAEMPKFGPPGCFTVMFRKEAIWPLGQ